MKKNLVCIICSAVLATSIVVYHVGKEFIRARADGFKPSEILSTIGTTTKLDSNCKQLVEVKANGSKATVTTYEGFGDNWTKKQEYSGYVGSNGVGTAQEGSSTTPLGVYYLGFGFGNKDASNTKIEYRYLNGNKKIYWVSDPSSNLYNKWVETDKTTWDTSKDEDLVNIGSAYNYAVVIEYNMHPVSRGNGTNAPGSAFFFHSQSLAKWIKMCNFAAFFEK